MTQALPENVCERQIDVNSADFFKIVNYWNWRNTVLASIDKLYQSRFELSISLDAPYEICILDEEDKDLWSQVAHLVEYFKSGNFSKGEVVKEIKKFDEYLYKKFGVCIRDPNSLELLKFLVTALCPCLEIEDDIPKLRIVEFKEDKPSMDLILQDLLPCYVIRNQCCLLA